MRYDYSIGLFDNVRRLYESLTNVSIDKDARIVDAKISCIGYTDTSRIPPEQECTEGDLTDFETNRFITELELRILELEAQE